MSLRSTANNENQRSRPVALSLTRHAGAGRHPSDPPHLDTGLRRYDGPRVTIPQVDIPTASLFEGGHEEHEVRKTYCPKPSCPSRLRGEHRRYDHSATIQLRRETQAP